MNIASLCQATNWFAQFQDPDKSYVSWRHVVAFAALNEPGEHGPVAAVVLHEGRTAFAHELPGYQGLSQLPPDQAAKILTNGSGFLQEFHPLSPNCQ